MQARDKPATVAQLLARYGIHPTKRFGQHFLIDRRHLLKLVRMRELADVRTIVEVGPGPGNLTELLVATPANVIAAEIDSRFVALLTDRFSASDNFKLIHADILHRGKLDPSVTSVLQTVWDRPWAVVSNLPYQVAATVILEMLYLPFPPELMCVTVQKDVARRLKASPATREFSALSVLVQSYTIVQLLSYVPAGAFWPRPNVDGAIIKLTPRAGPTVRDGRHLRNMVNAMFQARRKMLKTGFLHALPKAQLRIASEAFERLGIDPKARAQQLQVDDFIRLSNFMVESAGTPGP